MLKLKYKYLAYLASVNLRDGFTLIELLIVFIIVGILAAIALPSMLNQAFRAREAEARSYVGSVNRAQQVYRLDNTSFTNNMNDLKINIPTVSEGYRYEFDTTTTTLAEFKAFPQSGDLGAFTGCTTAIVVGNSATTNAEIIEESAGGGTAATPPSC